MIEYIQGDIAELSPTFLVLDLAGIGYGMHISLPTYTALNGKTRAKLYIHEVIREDAHLLYAFLDKVERSLFLLLVSVSGVGPNTARMILSSLTANELERVIATENINQLKSVKGIGVKTAQRIIVELKDKIKPTNLTLHTSTPATNEVQNEALAALTMLGFAQAPSLKAVQQLLTQSPTMRVEEVIKAALKMM